MAEYDINLEEALGAAIEAARKAGGIMWDFYQYRRETIATIAPKMQKDASDSVDVSSGTEAVNPSVSQLLDIKAKTSTTDLVTYYDKLCDEAIMNVLQQYSSTVENQKRGAGYTSFRFGFITEEICPDKQLEDVPTWIVDPIDGTMSFVHGSCDCCVSIGLTIKKETVLAVIYCPFLPSINKNPPGPTSSGVYAGEMYTAIRGQGAFLNGRRIVVQTDTTQDAAMVVFGYPMRPVLSAEEREKNSNDLEKARKEKHCQMLDAAAHIRKKLAMCPVQGLRSYGACALILAFVASGRIDLYMEPSGKIWDVCAGNLLVTEAGGVVKNIWGDEFEMERTTTIIAGANEKLVSFAAEICNEVSYGRFWL
ncbi:inositol-1(or 4)-monophosphatase, putative [Trypanosoma brucei gambiense DAL972]|uniref:Inositol-1-monophosphatase n=1 Tax=Trypanosoma brucei gambiense (strain MHOM/CI/86/DAL972) TaxID=679716 RepID=C9ZXW3_TRYB9|nr:inositol-1(or 4)-monophosphatase, putative [Trypanosoma brucei gambiense DAL972]CBH14258.1 inositol-1(or 4)-monophosphatase, putative [Trypanosoma brucei gambiense DAL972]|eukprot:XP_011776528.1 inositol-1(or 4)-monophosphatase, putative [Trypanosoma brucei gambiense DAL972]